MILAVLLHLVSIMSVRMNRDKKDIYNHSAVCIYNEPDNTIDVLAIGDSNTYSGICPLLWWENYGITGYSWGEPSQRIAETHEYLKRIYRHQRPSVVFIEANNIFRDKSDADNLDSMVKAGISNFFPVVTYHRNLDPKRLPNLLSDGPSLTKGYFVRPEIKKVRENQKPDKKRTDKNRPDKKSTDKKSSFKKGESPMVHPISSNMLAQCINLCRKNGSEVILLSVPSYNGWNIKKHNAISMEARKNHVDYLDLNLEIGNEINWQEDSCDGGDHLNVTGAKKTTTYLGRYLHEHYLLTDHRSEIKYKAWNEALDQYKRIMERIMKGEGK